MAGGQAARQGTGTDISTAEFTLVVHDCETDPAEQPTATEVFGFFRLPGDEHDDDSLVTASIVVPAGSPIARMAHQVRTGPDGRLTHKLDAVLRSNVARCPCAGTGCPALNDISLVLAMEHATGLKAAFLSGRGDFR
jgi:hypothetical protein